MRRRTHQTPKADLEPIVRELKVEYGLGCRTIGHLLGYSPRQIAYFCADFGMPNAKQFAALHKLVELMPAPLAAKIKAINARSYAARLESEGDRKPRALAPFAAQTHVDGNE